MIKTKTFFIACLFFLLLTCFRLIWLFHDSPSDQPKAVQGILDLRQWNMKEDQTIRLDGEWEFFPNTFLNPDESPKAPGEMISVPGKWNKFFSGETTPAYGNGTYRLKILVPKDRKQDYGMRLRSIRTAAKLFANGKLIEEIGVPATSPENHKGSALTFSSTLKPNELGEIELIIHASNYDHGGAGGIHKSIKFGSQYAIQKEFYFSASMQFLVLVIMLVHSLYAFILFSLRPKRKELLFFALGSLFFGICVVLDDDRLLLNILPLNYEWYIKIIKFSYMAMTACFLQFVKHLFFTQSHYKILDSLTIICVLSGTFTIIFPYKYIGFSPFNSLFIFVSFSTITLLIFKLMITEKRDVLFILLAALCIVSSLGWGISRGLGIVKYPAFYPYDIILAVVFFSTYWFKQFFHETEEREALYQKLQQEDQLKDRFLANISHELRNPLHGIINIAESIANEQHHSLNANTKNNMELLITISRRMALMLNDLMDITRIKEQGNRLEKQSVNIRTVVSGVLDMFQFMIERKPIQLAIDIPGRFPNVMADENRLIQILYNLIHNAVKFTSEGVISIRADEKNGMARIHVADTGIGIDKQTEQKIFDPYVQGNPSTAEGGLGLGLSICKQLVEMHGGILSVESTPGKGSVFTFTLQLDNEIEHPGIESVKATSEINKADQETAVQLQRSSTYVNASKVYTILTTDRPKILAVDDDSVNLKILSNILPPNEFELVTVTSGEEALAYLHTNEWDLVIADVMMPNMSGYELSRTIRKRFLISELPILLLTARSNIEDIVTGFLSGANDYVTKPINSLELKARVNALANLKQSISERLRMEAAWLQAQIQPHFLFNTLNTIASLSEIDTDRMSSLLEKFGQYLQKSFSPINLQRSVPLEHEIELLKAYLYIEQERFGNKLQIEWKVDTVLDLHVPPLSIQTLVENAIRHGVLKRIDGGTILISIMSDKKDVEIMVQDNGVGMDKEKIKQILSSQAELTKGIGLVNTNKRLKQMFGTELAIHSTVGKGTTVSFKIPKLQ
ncbi:ATP-binding protein [Siminovitchia sp. FSL H7-0308]|uniref:hybrid sensor histidine kinase/response regulator n=1 Tax=Siminovitchia sp. FSL H7-0308 TaxID=2921432 RepID=UPI0030EBC8B4